MAGINQILQLHRFNSMHLITHVKHRLAVQHCRNVKCYLGDASRGQRLSHREVNSKLNLKMTIFADANRSTGKTSTFQNKFFGDCSWGCNCMKVLVHR